MRKTHVVAVFLAAASIALTGCDPDLAPRPSTDPTATSKPDPTTTQKPAPPAGGESSAPAGYTLVISDEFNSGSKPDSKWGMYDGEGHGGNGQRKPSAFSIADGVLTVTGSANGVSGGMALDGGQKYGYWETRMKVTPGDPDYHPVLLLWPDAENFPVGGEIDYAEMESTSKDVDFFLHFGSSNSQTNESTPVDITQWHTYSVKWTAAGIWGYVDGKEFFSDTNKGHLPPGPMHATIQLDAFGGDSGYKETKMQVDWIRQYKAA
jgi:hypothetical protein